jgi:L-fuculose-phosphate aldolase
MRSVEQAHQAVLATAKQMLRKRLVEGTSGNISARLADGNIVCTPSSVDYEAMTLEDLVVVDLDGQVLERAQGRSPTSEILLHLACYKAFDDIGSVIHAHPVWATMFAVSHQPVPACIDEFTMYAGGDVRCAAYAPSGSAEVGANAVEALQGRGAALLANHGMVAIGPSPAKVLHIVALVERTAQIAWGGRALGGVVPLPDKANSDFAGVYQLMRSL